MNYTFPIYPRPFTSENLTYGMVHCYHQWDKGTGICRVCNNIVYDKEYLYDDASSYYKYDEFLGRMCKFYRGEIEWE